MLVNNLVIFGLRLLAIVLAVLSYLAGKWGTLEFVVFLLVLLASSIWDLFPGKDKNGGSKKG